LPIYLDKFDHIIKRLF